MLIAYISEAMARATYKILGEGSYFGEIPGLPGVWANESTLEECRKVLQEVLEEWLLLKLRDDEEIPPLGEVSLARDSLTSRDRCSRLGASLEGAGLQRSIHRRGAF